MYMKPVKLSNHNRLNQIEIFIDNNFTLCCGGFENNLEISAIVHNKKHMVLFTNVKNKQYRNSVWNYFQPQTISQIIFFYCTEWPETQIKNHEFTEKRGNNHAINIFTVTVN